MKRLLPLLTAVLLLGSLAFGTVAAGNGNACGENLTWSYENGTLVISGTGDMYDYPQGAPWDAYKGELRSLRLEGGVTRVGENAFLDCDALETLDLGTSLVEAGKGSFSSCDSLKTVDLPGSFRIFGEESFSHCHGLTEFHFAGGMPSFKYNCLWDTSAKLIYPAERPWPLEHIRQLEEAFQGRIEFLASDGTDPYVPEGQEPVPAPTQAPTEAPTIAPTEAPATAPTTAPTEAPTTVPTQAPTVPQTQAETRPAVPELPENQEIVELPEPEEKHVSLGLVVLVAVMVLSGLGLIVMAVVLVKNRTQVYEEDFAQPQIPPRPKKQTPPTPKAPRPQTPQKPTQAEKTARKQDRSHGGKFSR